MLAACDAAIASATWVEEAGGAEEEEEEIGEVLGGEISYVMPIMCTFPGRLTCIQEVWGISFMTQGFRV